MHAHVSKRISGHTYFIPSFSLYCSLPVQEMAWVTFNSPLWRKDIVQDKVKPLPSLKVKRKMEHEFVNDGIRTTNRTNRRKPIIPPYNALRDRYAQAYFQSPLVKAMKERNFHLKVRNIKSFYCLTYEDKLYYFRTSVIKYSNK